MRAAEVPHTEQDVCVDFFPPSGSLISASTIISVRCAAQGSNVYWCSDFPRSECLAPATPQRVGSMANATVAVVPALVEHAGGLASVHAHYDVGADLSTPTFSIPLWSMLHLGDRVELRCPSDAGEAHCVVNEGAAHASSPRCALVTAGSPGVLTVRALCVQGYRVSPMVTHRYHVRPAPRLGPFLASGSVAYARRLSDAGSVVLSVNPPTGEYHEPLTVTLAAEPPDDVILYDEHECGASIVPSTVYTGPILLAGPRQRCMTAQAQSDPSSLVQATYSVYKTLSAVQFDLDPGTRFIPSPATLLPITPADEAPLGRVMYAVIAGATSDLAPAGSMQPAPAGGILVLGMGPVTVHTYAKACEDSIDYCDLVRNGPMQSLALELVRGAEIIEAAIVLLLCLTCLRQPSSLPSPLSQPMESLTRRTWM